MQAQAHGQALIVLGRLVAQAQVEDLLEMVLEPEAQALHGFGHVEVPLRGQEDGLVHDRRLLPGGAHPQYGGKFRHLGAVFEPGAVISHGKAQGEPEVRLHHQPAAVEGHGGRRLFIFQHRGLNIFHVQAEVLLDLGVIPLKVDLSGIDLLAVADR